MDPSVRKGTGTPVDNGLYLDEANEILSYLAEKPKCLAMEMVEINPLLDNENAMAKSALGLFETMFNSLGKD